MAMCLAWIVTCAAQVGGGLGVPSVIPSGQLTQWQEEYDRSSEDDSNSMVRLLGFMSKLFEETRQFTTSPLFTLRRIKYHWRAYVYECRSAQGDATYRRMREERREFHEFVKRYFDPDRKVPPALGFPILSPSPGVQPVIPRP